MIISKYLSKYYKRYFHKFLIGVIALVFVDYLQTLVPLILGNVTDNIVTFGVVMDSILGSCLKIAAIGISIGVGRLIWRVLIFGASRDIEFSLRNELYDHLQKQSVEFYTKNKTGDIMAHLTNDINAVRMAIGPGLMMLVDATVLVFLVLLNMVRTIDYRLTLMAIIPFPLIILQGTFLSKHMKERFRSKQEAFAKLTDMVQESYSGISVIKAFRQESKEMKSFINVNKNNYDKNIGVIKLHSMIEPVNRGVVGISLVITIIYGGKLAISGVVSAGDLVAFINYLTMLVWPMMAVGMILNVISQGKASMERLEKILDYEPEIADEKDTDYGITEIKGNIEAKNLSFTYPLTEIEALKDINLSIKAGETIGVIGDTGSGKSTFVNLLLRMFNVKRDSIYIDNKDIMTIPLNVLRNNIGYVPQDSFLFSDTVTNNIGFSLDEIDSNSVMTAAKQSNVHENILEFDNKYETLIGERGVNLSGGQKQRISISRALIKNAPILILDDSVSAVDTETEEKILGAIRKLRAGKTTIIIAHRISTIENADKIVFIDDGKIVEEGSHNELIKLNGKYKAIFDRQQLKDKSDDNMGGE